MGQTEHLEVAKVIYDSIAHNFFEGNWRQYPLKNELCASYFEGRFKEV